jgi:6-phosphogluconolactonase/glucosamine-6-phosphate isomerase/deaminase
MHSTQNLGDAGRNLISMTVDESKIARFEDLKIEICSSREAAGGTAAIATAEALPKVAAIRESFGVIFATGASQGTMEALSRIDHLPWGQVHGFNPDHYVGLLTDNPPYLHDKLPQRAQMKSFLEVTVCPFTILRTHPNATLHLDEESAAEITDLTGHLNR